MISINSTSGLTVRVTVAVTMISTGMSRMPMSMLMSFTPTIDDISVKYNSS